MCAGLDRLAAQKRAEKGVPEPPAFKRPRLAFEAEEERAAADEIPSTSSGGAAGLVRQSHHERKFRASKAETPSYSGKRAPGCSEACFLVFKHVITLRVPLARNFVLLSPGFTYMLLPLTFCCVSPTSLWPSNHLTCRLFHYLSNLVPGYNDYMVANKLNAHVLLLLQVLRVH